MSTNPTTQTDLFFSYLVSLAFSNPSVSRSAMSVKMGPGGTSHSYSRLTRR